MAVRRADETRAPVLSRDVDVLERAIGETGAVLVVIDPVSAYLGNTDSHRDAEVRAVLTPLAALAERTGVAIVGVMHLGKDAQRPALYRAIGSIGFVAAARIVLAVAPHPEDDTRRMLAPLKANICAPAPALAYTLADGRLTWEADPVSDVDVEALLAGPALDRQERREADAWLREVLAEGPLPSRQIQSAARGAGLAWRTVERAKRRLGIEAELIGCGAAGRWYWRLTETATSETETATHGDVAVSEPARQKPAQPTGLHSEAATLGTVAETVADRLRD